jgi:glutathione peroxidase
MTTSTSAPDLYTIPVRTIHGETTTLAPYKGQVLLIVNVASQCGFTKQYEDLEALYRAHKDRGFVVLGFPCNQFGQQEPGTEEEILAFCQSRYDVTFPMFAKIDVNGENAHPLYRHLTSARRGLLGTAGIKWNFTKFLVDPSGAVVKRYAPTVSPRDIETDVLSLLT